MNDDQLLHEVGRWLQDADPAPPDANERVRQAMARTPQVRQRGRWWPLPILRRTVDPPTVHRATTYRPSPIPATNGHTPTVLGRTQSMFSPVKAITAGAVIFALGGTLLIAQPFGQPSSVPGAATETDVIAPVEFTAYVSFTSDCTSPDFEGVVDGVEQHRGYRCRTTVEDSSDARFAGAWLLVFSEDGYGMGPELRAGTGDGAPTVWTYEYRVENDDGAWQSGPVSGIEFAEREMSVTPVFTGEGAYEGLTAIVELSGRETDNDGVSDASLRGAILVGSPPPPSGFPSSE